MQSSTLKPEIHINSTDTDPTNWHKDSSRKGDLNSEYHHQFTPVRHTNTWVWGGAFLKLFKPLVHMSMLRCIDIYRTFTVHEDTVTI